MDCCMLGLYTTNCCMLGMYTTNYCMLGLHTTNFYWFLRADIVVMIGRRIWWIGKMGRIVSS